MTRSDGQGRIARSIERLWYGWSVRRVWLSVGLAVVVATALALSAPWWVILVLVLVLPLSLCWRRLRRPLWCLLVTATVFILFSTTGYRHWVVRPLAQLSGRQDVVTGHVVENSSGGNLVILQVSKAQLVPVGTKVGLFCDAEYAPTVGDIATAAVVLYTPEERSVTISQKDVFLFAEVVDEDEQNVTFTSPNRVPPWDSGYWRNRLYRALTAYLPGTEGAMVAALCLGVREHLPQAVTDAFRGSGLAHLLAVSGLHLSLLAVILRRLFRRLGASYRWSALLTMPVVLVFMWLVGFTPSVCRAGLMCLLWLGGYLLGRRSDGLNALGLAAALILSQNPYTLWEVGFQLSFLATAGVLLLYPRLRRWMPRVDRESLGLVRLCQQGAAAVYGAVAVCISALLFTIPVACYYFDGFSVLTLISNLLAVAPAGWALLMGWVGLLLSLCPGLGWLAQPVLYATGLLTRYLRLVAESLDIDAFFLAAETRWQGLLIAALCLIMIVALLCRVSRRQMLAWCLTLTVLTVAVGYPLTHHTTRVQIHAVPGGTAVVLTHRGKTALLFTESSGLEEAIYDYRRWGCTRLDALVVGQGHPVDATDLATLAEHTHTPAVYTADPDQWAKDSTHCAVGTTLTLWEGCHLTFVTEDWWLLETAAGSLLLGQGAESEPPVPADLTVWAGVPTVPLTTRGVVVCSADRLGRDAPEWGEKTYLLTEGSVAYATRPGKEWSVLPWL